MSQPALTAGAAAVEITPPMGVEMCGYGPYQKRVCTEVLDPLYARAVWVEVGGQAAAILAADLCTVDLSLRQQVAGELSGRCGLDPAHLMIAASHTHSGPATQLMVGWGQRDPGYLSRLPGLLAGAALAARASAGPAKLGAARVRVNGVGVNREQFFAPTDTACQLLRVDRADGSPIAVAYNYGAHGVGRYPFTSRISADWPGLLSAYIQFQMPGVLPVFLQGPCGNVNAHPMSFARQDPQIEQKVADMRTGATATCLGDQIIPALKCLRTEPSGEVRCLWKVIDLPCVPPQRAALEGLIAEKQPLADSMTLEQLRPLHQRLTSETLQERSWREARYQVDSARRQLELLERPPYVCPAPIQVMKVGPAVLVGWPGEVFCELGMELRQRSPFPLTFVVSFANDAVGYIPTPAVWESKGRGNDFGRYPRELTPFIYGRLPFRPDVGRVLVEGTLAMLVDLWSRTAGPETVAPPRP